jgi:inosose dehydratase
MHSDQFAVSLDLINRHYSEPNRNRYESKYFWEELYPLIGAAGFRSIEIPYEPVWQFGGRSGVPMNRAALARGDIDRVSGVTFDPNLFMRNANLDFYFGATGHFAGEALAHAADLKAAYLAISPSAYYGRILHYHPHLEDELGAFTDRVADLLGGLAAKARAAGVTLVLRNEYWSVFRGERILPLLERLPEDVKLDVDTASLTIAGIDPAAFITAQRDRIGCVHLTDTAFVDKAETWKTPNPEFPEHRATQVFRDPGTGTVDLPAIVSLLDRIGYAGPVICSARQTRDPFRALLRPRALLSHLQN